MIGVLPQGVKPVRRYSFEEFLMFNLKQGMNHLKVYLIVPINTAQIYVITKFNRIPSVSQMRC